MYLSYRTYLQSRFFFDWLCKVDRAQVIIFSSGGLCITPCTQVAHPHNPQLAESCEFFSYKEGLLFSLIDHPARPIGGGGSNQRELLESPCSPSPCASLATLLLPVGRADEAQRQSRRNAGGANLGW